MKMANNYYQKHKGRLWKKACERYKDISAEGKIKKAANSPIQISKSS